MLRERGKRFLFIARRLKCLVFIGIIVGLFLSSLTEAIEIVQIDQPKIRLSVLPGNSQTGIIKVTNRSSEPKHIKAYLEDWLYLPGGDGSKEFLPPGTTELSAAKWISFAPAEFVVPPYGKRDINYTVRVPEEARRGHYAILFFEGLLGEPPERKEGVAVSVAVRIGALFYIETEGTINRNAMLENINVQREKKDTFLEIRADFVNTGNVDITTSGTYYIIDKQGMVYGRGKFNDVYTFPNDRVKLYAICKELIPQGVYDLVITLEIGRGSTLVEEVRMEVGSSGEIFSFGVVKE